MDTQQKPSINPTPENAPAKKSGTKDKIRNVVMTAILILFFALIVFMFIKGRG